MLQDLFRFILKGLGRNLDPLTTISVVTEGVTPRYLFTKQIGHPRSERAHSLRRLTHMSCLAHSTVC